MSINALFVRSVGLAPRLRCIFAKRSLASTSKENDLDITSLVEQPSSFVEYEAEVSEEEILRKRDKSRLYPQHKNVLHGRPPYEESKTWAHDTVRYKRLMLGRYGMQEVGVPVGVAWPTPEEVEEAKEYERLAYPETIQEMWSKIAEKKAADAAAIVAREEDIAKKLGKLEDWKNDLNARLAKKEADAKAARDRKERLVEEVRRHFGFKMNPKDERFKEMLEKKEKEEKKSVKEAKRKAKEAKMLAKLTQNPKPGDEKPSENAAKPANTAE